MPKKVILPKRRANNTGCIVERKDRPGKFKGFAPDATAKDGRRWFGGTSYEDVEDKIDEFLNPTPAEAELPNVPTVDAAALEDLAILKGKKRSPDTIRSYESFRRVHFYPVIGGKAVTEVTPGDVEVIMAGAAMARPKGRVRKDGQPAAYAPKENSASTINRIREYGRGLYNRLHRRYPKLDFPPNPFVAVDPVTDDQIKAKKILSTDARNQVIDSAPGPEYRAIYALGLLRGVRQAEILGLSEDRIHFDEGYILFDRQLKRVSGKLGFRKIKGRFAEKIVSLEEPLVGYLRAALAARKVIPMIPSTERFCEPSEASLVFPGPRGEGLDGSVVTHTFQTTLASLDLERIPFHRTRTTFVSLARAKGVDFEVLSEVVGHTDERTTKQHYTVVQLDRQKKAMRKAGNSSGNSSRQIRKAGNQK